MYMKIDKSGSLGSNTDIGSKKGVQCTNTTILYLAFVIKNLFQNVQLLMY